MTDKMREAFEEWYIGHAFRRSGSRFSAESIAALQNGEKYNDDCSYLNALWEAWQAAQSVPVVGEVAWEAFPSYLLDHQEGSTVTEENLQFWLSAMIKDPQYNKPTHSISANELERLQGFYARRSAIIEALNVAFQHIDKTTHCNDWEKVNAAIAAEGEK